MYDQYEEILNSLLVEVFNTILKIEEQSLRGPLCADLSITEVHQMTAIGSMQSKTMTQLAGILLVSISTLTTSMNRLVKKGYVHRRRSEEDRRVVIVSLTEKGEMAVARHDLFHRDMIRHIIRNHSEEELLLLSRAIGSLHDFFRIRQAANKADTSLKWDEAEGKTGDF
jgi:DNA-binding MarR family transcriptional regulator